MSRFVRPEITTIKISQGDTLTVKRRLNSGEERDLFSRMYLPGVDGQLKVNPFAAGVAMITAYLLDWSLTDDDGKLVVIRELSPESMTSVLNGLNPETFAEIRSAVEAHDDGVRAARAEEKKAKDGETALPVTSPSHSAVTGPLPTSVN
jgi:hypothetical protein